MDAINKKKTIRKQVSRRLEDLREFKNLTAGISSWSKYVREGLGMSLSQLAHRMKIAQSTMSETEDRERDGSITLNKLKQVADALNCDLVYAFIPRKKLDDLVYEQARMMAGHSITSSGTHMELEDQKVETDEERLNEIIEDKMYSKYLWEFMKEKVLDR